MGILTSAKAIAIVCTRDLDKAKLFFRDVLGLTLVSEDPYASVFAMGDIKMRLSTVPNFTPHDHTVVGFEVADIARDVKALAAKGVKFKTYEGFGQDALGIWVSPDKSARVAWFNDPDGNVLSLTQF